MTDSDNASTVELFYLSSGSLNGDPLLLIPQPTPPPKKKALQSTNSKNGKLPHEIM